MYVYSKNCSIPGCLAGITKGVNVQAITVAVVEIDQEQQISVDKLVQQNNKQIKLLIDNESSYNSQLERRQESRHEMTVIDNALARIKRLSPRVLLVNANNSIEEYCDFLLALQYLCPDTHAIMVINETVRDDYLFRTLASGARGFILSDLNSLDLSKVVKAVDQGEIWISRKMQGKIMEQIVIAFQHEMREESL